MEHAVFQRTESYFCCDCEVYTTQFHISTREIHSLASDFDIENFHILHSVFTHSWRAIMRRCRWRSCRRLSLS